MMPAARTRPPGGRRKQIAQGVRKGLVGAVVLGFVSVTAAPNAFAATDPCPKASCHQPDRPTVDVDQGRLDAISKIGSLQNCREDENLLQSICE
jgi:hypothetical protein